MVHFLRGLFVCAGICTLAFAAEDPKPADKVAESPAVASPDKEMPKSVQELAAAVKKSVVVVTFRGRNGERQGLGAGFVIDPNGLIATNLHVIGEARPISVELHDGRKFDVTAIEATERSHDLAIIRIDAKDLPVLPLGNSDELQEGQSIIAVGNPLGLERSVVSGVLSGRREIEGRTMLQVAVPIERGNSGGPLLDMRGRVHGLLTLKSLKSENLGFAMPINAIKPMLSRPNPIPMKRWLTIGVLDSDEWTTLAGARWRQRAGRIVVDGLGAGIGGRSLCLATKEPPSVPFEITVEVKFEPTDGAAGLAFHADGGDKHYGFYPSNGKVRLSRFDGPDVTSWKVLREVHTAYLNKIGWNTLKVRVESERMLCYLNDELIIEETDVGYTSGRVGLCKFRQTEAEFKGFRVAPKIARSQPAPEVAERVAKMVTDLKSDSQITGVTDALLGDGEDGVELLEEQAIRLEQKAERVRKLAANIQMKRTLSDFKNVISVKDEPIDLLRAGMLISRLDNAELDVDAYIQEVERHAKRAVTDLPKDADEATRFAALNRYLFEEQGFHGSRTDYDNRSNSYLNEVLDDREGLPISLSVLYIEIGRRMKLNIVGVGMPKHFLVRHEPKDGPHQLVDVFERGQLITKDEARKKFETVSEWGWNDEYLDTSPPQSILLRMLQNLFPHAFNAKDFERCFKYVEAMVLIDPDSAELRARRAMLCFQTQRWEQAKADVKWMREHPAIVNQEAVEELSNAIDRESSK